MLYINHISAILYSFFNLGTLNNLEILTAKTAENKYANMVFIFGILGISRRIWFAMYPFLALQLSAIKCGKYLSGFSKARKLQETCCASNKNAFRNYQLKYGWTLFWVFILINNSFCMSRFLNRKAKHDN